MNLITKTGLINIFHENKHYIYIENRAYHINALLDKHRVLKH
jgi:hypothetical protein